MVKAKFCYVHYLVIDLELTSFLHIGGENNEEELSVNGSGQYIIPASGTAGAVRDYVTKNLPAYDLDRWFGMSSDKEKSMSKILFYDSQCNDCKIEKRTGIRINPDYGVAEDGSLREKYFIGNGMKTNLKIQFFTESTEENDTAEKIIESIIIGFSSGRIRLGASKTNGAGIFRVIKAYKAVLDLKKNEDLDKYLNGVEAAFDKYIAEFEIPEIQDYGRYAFSLYASIPNGLIVKSGKTEIIKSKDEDSSHEFSLNMRKTITELGGEEKNVYFIPGSTIKGVIRSYASQVCDHLGISQTIIGRIFGQQDENGDKIAGKVVVEDVIINDPNERIYNRVKIDRWLGSAIDGALFSDKVLSTSKKNKLKINIDILDERFSKDEKKIRDSAYGLVFLALRDVGLGLVPIGSGNNVGYGRLKGTNLNVENSRFRFKDSCLVCEDDNEELVKGYLAALGGLRNEGE